MRSQRTLLLLVAVLIGMIAPSAANAARPSPTPVASQLLSGLAGGSGSTVGPGGALYVTDDTPGAVYRLAVS